MSILKQLGINTLQDLIEYFPYKYKDFSKTKQLSDVIFGEELTLVGIVKEKKQEISKKG
ncbi:MAG TPA: hypothetical protein EYP36_13240 [Calditrichaeota bacterium]|nr:hypothetical protein [Calditrichota bacterium]